MYSRKHIELILVYLGAMTYSYTTPFITQIYLNILGFKKPVIGYIVLFATGLINILIMI